jgi:putative Ca2+/H+ antiporter (TMEM165/GDT1 family)
LGGLLTHREIELAVGIGMIAMSFWTFLPDRSREESAPAPRREVFLATAMAFFIGEIGDKTQIATIALAAAYSRLAVVVAGTTGGMLAANFPIIFLGNAFAPRLPLRTIRVGASLVFVLLGLVFLIRALLPQTGP